MDPDPDSCPSLRHAEAPARGPLVTVDVLRQDARWPDDSRAQALMRRAGEEAFRAAAPAGRAGEIAIVLTNDAQVRELNRRWRGKDAATNVLSFPLRTPVHPAGACPSGGDIVLAYETVAREAEASGIALLDHAAHLIVHGTLHLLGHDHERDEEAEIMEALEGRVLEGMGIRNPYADEARAHS